MHETLTIMRRELKSYFYSPIAYVFGALFLGIVCSLGALGIKHGFQARMSGFFQLLPLVFLFFLPALTMRLWAEERRAGTLELLMTFPVTIRQLIAGKFLASMTYLTLLLALTLGLPITMSMYGELDWVQVGITYVASLFLAAAYVSIGMFWSSLTRDQVIAFLACVVTLFVMFYGASLLNYFFGGELPKWLGGEYTIYVLSALNPKGYFDSISYGVADTGDLVYYVCFCAFFLHANALVLHGKRVKG